MPLPAVAKHEDVEDGEGAAAGVDGDVAQVITRITEEVEEGMSDAGSPLVVTELTRSSWNCLWIRPEMIRSTTTFRD
jgi:hypothetical protein